MKSWGDVLFGTAILFVVVVMLVLEIMQARQQLPPNPGFNSDYGPIAIRRGSYHDYVCKFGTPHGKWNTTNWKPDDPYHGVRCDKK